jgi:glycosyltransferase involved in cell wall biosynthesis
MGSAAEQSGVAGGTKVAAATGKLEMWMCRHATQIGVVATGFRDRLIQSGVSAEKVHVTRNWSHIGEPTVSRADIRARLGLPLDRFIALHAGNMGLKQGLDYIIDAARIARGTSPDTLFVLMGDGNQRERLQQMAVDLDNVRFLLPQDEEVFPSILAASDVLLVSQRPTVIDMSLPSKLTSYFTVGRPVIAAVSPQSETAKVIAESGGGLLVDPSDSVALVSALESLSRTPFRAQQIGERGMAYATSHLSAEAALANLERLIHSAHHRAVADTKELATT